MNIFSLHNGSNKRNDSPSHESQINSSILKNELNNNNSNNRKSLMHQKVVRKGKKENILEESQNRQQQEEEEEEEEENNEVCSGGYDDENQQTIKEKGNFQKKKEMKRNNNDIKTHLKSQIQDFLFDNRETILAEQEMENKKAQSSDEKKENTKEIQTNDPQIQINQDVLQNAFCQDCDSSINSNKNRQMDTFNQSINQDQILDSKKSDPIQNSLDKQSLSSVANNNSSKPRGIKIIRQNQSHLLTSPLFFQIQSNKSSKEQSQSEKKESSLPLKSLIDSSIQQSQKIAEEVKLKDYNDNFIFSRDKQVVQREEQDLLKCSICNHIFEKPVACGNCLNHYCQHCILEWQQRNNSKCPFCKNYKEMKCFPMLKNMLETSSFFCRNREQGCQEILSHQQLSFHLSKCQFKAEICQLEGCGQQVINKLMKNHLEQECGNVIVNCKWCSIQVIRSQRQNHEQNCSQRQVPCDKCNESILVKSQFDHINFLCPMAMVQCTHCKMSYLKKEVNDHEQGCESRIVSCVGCQEQFKFSDYYKTHNSSCQQILIQCQICNTYIKRYQQEDHSKQKCFQTVYQQMGVELKKLREQHKLIKQELQEQYVHSNTLFQSFNKSIQELESNYNNNNNNILHRFSNLYKDQDIFVNRDGSIALVSMNKRKRRDRFIIVDSQQQLQQSNQCIQLRIASISSDWFAIGICHESNVYTNRRYHDIGHKSYLISANGVLYSSHSLLHNWTSRQFKIDKHDIISIHFNVYHPNNNNNNQASTSLPPLSSNRNNNSLGDRVGEANASNNISNQLRYLSRQVIQSLFQQRNSSRESSSSSNNNNYNANSNSSLNTRNANNFNIMNINYLNRVPIRNQNRIRMELKFVNHSKIQELIIPLDPAQIMSGKFYFCACLRCPGDIIEIVRSQQQQQIDQLQSPEEQSLSSSDPIQFEVFSEVAPLIDDIPSNHDERERDQILISSSSLRQIIQQQQQELHQQLGYEREEEEDDDEGEEEADE